PRAWLKNWSSRFPYAARHGKLSVSPERARVRAITFSQESRMTRLLTVALAMCLVVSFTFAQDTTKPAPKVAVGTKAPAFTFKDQSGKVIDLAELTAKGPVLVRLTCG